ncbi:threonine ammonia-lyase, biosynthetic [Mangrovimicrobium sediminis]|uniref:L-threonine dehydratase biosynthetic IlvA n=1 Tax=Mangrovimicrobium sediminis TaxID=2562682 RepID=A0A4Z0M0E3_9GAMM|nr:threonine ammonia-lyase, biosynthetic [Haliea sp. SAOS-164]TGD73072.1 threonine ammonia-lyase, biosynthetic [Haliea sp. SAOS-164]
MPHTYIKRILDARVYDVARETPVDYAELMSRRLDNHVWLKREDLQPVFSFKLRGAYNKMNRLSEEQRQRGVVAASAGNHAQGLAMAAQRMHVKATIVMPRTTPAIKVDAVRNRGARVVLHGDTFDEAAAHAAQLVEEKGMTYVHPFDDPDVIAGQGTVGMEIVRQHQQPLDAIFVPVGGGGLLAGVAAYVKYVWPQTKLIGVEPEDAACLKLALEKGRRARLSEVGLFADGCAVAQIGKETFRVIRKLVDEVITVSSDEMCAAIKDIFEDTRSIAEPAGALALAGIKSYVERTGVQGDNLLAIVSGANTNFDRLRYISERTEIGERREAVLSVTIPERAGSFREFCHVLGRRNITEFNYRYVDSGSAQVFVGLSVVPGGEDLATLLGHLEDSGYSALDLTDNEVAKLHVRYMVGGHAPADLDNERVYRVEFPERPGTLAKFLSGLGQRWNISMFHYRNHGSAFGRILVGVQVPPGDRREFEKVLDGIGYPYSDESDNPAYALYLGQRGD